MAIYLSIISMFAVSSLFVCEEDEERILTIFLTCFAGVIAGLRYEIGYDWLAYENYFNNIDFFKLNTISYYPNNNGNEFEVGYFLLNCLVKLFNGDVWIVFLLASLFHAIALATLISHSKKYMSFVSLFYIGFCYFTAQYILVRYSIATGFIFLSIASAANDDKKSTYLLALTGMLFHFFVVLSFLSIAIRKHRPNLNIVIYLLIIMIYFNYDADLQKTVYGFLATIIPEKYGVYFSEDFRQYTYSSYVYLYFNVFVCALLYRIKNGDKHEDYMVNMAIILTLTLIASIGFFPWLPSLWNRIMIIAVPVQGVSLTILMRQQNSSLVNLIKIFIIAVSVTAYLYLLTKEGSLYVPYKSQLHRDFGFSVGHGRAALEFLYEQ